MALIWRELSSIWHWQLETALMYPVISRSLKSKGISFCAIDFLLSFPICSWELSSSVLVHAGLVLLTLVVFCHWKTVLGLLLRIVLVGVAALSCDGSGWCSSRMVHWDRVCRLVGWVVLMNCGLWLWLWALVHCGFCWFVPSRLWAWSLGRGVDCNMDFAGLMVCLASWTALNPFCFCS